MIPDSTTLLELWSVDSVVGVVEGFEEVKVEDSICDETVVAVRMVEETEEVS